MNRSPLDPTLRDLLRILRQNWVLAAVILAIAVVSSVVYSVRQTPVYKASATLAFEDPTRDLGLAGVAVPATQTPAQLAAANAQTLLRPRAVARAKRRLRSKLSVAELQDSATATVRPSSNLVEIKAEAPTARGAQHLANALAQAGADEANRRVRTAFAVEARQLERRKAGQSGPAARDLFAQQIAKLRTLSTISSAAQVASEAREPTSPTSPRPLRNAALGAALGLVLALLAVFARNSFDRRLQGATEIQSEFDAPLLGQVGDSVLGHGARPGADEAVSSRDWELFHILRRNLDFVDGDPSHRVVAVTSALPEEGKTTVASFLAFASGAAGKRALLVECDLRRAVLAQRLDLPSAPGLSDYVAGHADRAAVTQRISFSRPTTAGRSNGSTSQADPVHLEHEVECITAGTPTSDPIEVFRSKRFEALLEEARAEYDLVILDTTPLLAVVDVLELLPNVSAVVLCIRAHRTTRDQARASRAALNRLPDKPIGLVVTGASTRDHAEYGYYGYYAHASR